MRFLSFVCFAISRTVELMSFGGPLIPFPWISTLSSSYNKHAMTTSMRCRLAIRLMTGLCRPTGDTRKHTLRPSWRIEDYLHLLLSKSCCRMGTCTEYLYSPKEVRWIKIIFDPPCESIKIIFVFRWIYQIGNGMTTVGRVNNWTYPTFRQYITISWAITIDAKIPSKFTEMKAHWTLSRITSLARIVVFAT